MYERKQGTGGRAGIGTIGFGVGLGLVLTTLWGLRYRRNRGHPGCNAEAGGEMSSEDLLDQLRRHGLI